MKKIVIREDVQIPGTGIMLEKGDTVFIRDNSKRMGEAYNENKLAKALGCRSLNFERLPLNDDIQLLVYDGEGAGEFYLADNNTGTVEFTGFYRDVAEAFYDRSGEAGVIRFRDGSSIVIRELGGFLDIEKRNFESAPKKSDKKNVKETTEDVLFRATTRGGKDYIEIYQNELDKRDNLLSFRTRGAGGGIQGDDNWSLGSVMDEIISPDETYEKIIIDKFGISSILKDTYKKINTMFGDLKKAPNGSKEHQLWFAVWRGLGGQLRQSGAKTPSALKTFIDKTLSAIEDKVNDILNG